MLLPIKMTVIVALAAGRSGTEQVPLVASDVEEHRDPAVGFRARCRHELDASGCHLRVGGVVLSVSSRQQQACCGTGRPDYHPPLGTPVVGQGRGVLYELETQCAHEETDRWVILADHDGDETEMHCASIGGADQLAGSGLPPPGS